MSAVFSRRPWGRNEYVTNEPQRTSAGRLLRGTNSTTTNYITGTPNFNSNENSFRTLSSQRLFGSIVINLTETTLAAVILDFSTLSGTNPQI